MIMRSLTLPLLPLVFLAGCAASPPPMPATTPSGIDLGAAKGTAPASAVTVAQSQTRPQSHAQSHDPGRGHSAMTHAPGEVPGHGTIEAIDPGRRRVTLAHDPMPEIGWPAMTMVFAVPANTDLLKFKPGHHVDFMLRKGASGSYDLIDIRPSDH